MPLAAVCMLSASCSDDYIFSPAGGCAIRFEVSAAEPSSRSEGGVSLSSIALESGAMRLYLIPEVKRTALADFAASRSEAVTTDNISNFGVYASLGSSQPYYMDNVEVTKDNLWAPRKEYLWPGTGSLHINAYSPFCAAPDATVGITALPADAPEIAYAVPSDVADQEDLMWATPCDASESPCALVFNHALAGVRFVAGGQMQPCTVKSISLSGLAYTGTLSLETGQWADVSGNVSYSAQLDVALAAADGSEYVAAGTAITDAKHTFMLMPQTLADGAVVTIVIECAGADVELSASLGGQAWNAGNTYTYHLSASPATDRFDISVDSPISFNYTGGAGTFSVKSIHETMNGGVFATSDVPWEAEFVDADGNVIPMPSWIISMDMNGDGSGQYAASTQMVEPTFVHISEPSRILRERPERGSAASPYNLASSTGVPTVENTANTYVINSPGTYSIPLVYGNAIKDGADNTAAYIPTRTSAPFFNHLGNRIKHPYIYDNDGCNPAGAKLVWEGRLNMIHNLALSPDGKSIVFEIPRAYIRQGNAVVAVTDAAGTIMWSWQLWVTDYVPGTDMSTMTYNGAAFEVMPYNMGYVVGGDEVDFASSAALVRFKQKPANGEAGSSVTVAVQQTGKHIITPDCYSFYQWGRKDPMISAIKEWYYADHTEITQISTQNPTETGGKLGDEYETQSVKNPQVFWVVGTGEPSFKYTNNWNTGTTTRLVKTIYDPCPVGYIVPGSEFMAFRDLDASAYTFRQSGGTSDPAGFSVTCTSGPDLFFPALGYRSGNSGNETVSSAEGGSLATLWTSHATAKEGSALVLNQQNAQITHSLPNDPRLEAFAIRPIKE